MKAALDPFMLATDVADYREEKRAVPRDVPHLGPVRGQVGGDGHPDERAHLLSR